MKSKFGKLFLVCGALLALTVGVVAQGYRVSEPRVLIAGDTNTVAALSTNSYAGLTVECAYQENVAIQVHGGLTISNWAALRLDFMPLVDGSTWVSTNFMTVSVQASTNNLSAGIFCTVTNLPLMGYRKLKLFRVANLDFHAAPTNLTVTYGEKR